MKTKSSIVSFIAHTVKGLQALWELVFHSPNKKPVMGHLLLRSPEMWQAEW